VFEVSGTQAGLDLAGGLVRQHGTVSIVGYHQGGPRTVDMETWNFKAIDVVNAHVRRDADRMASMRIGLDLIGAGRLDLGWMVTHRYGLDELDRAFGDLETKPAGFVKGVVFPASA
jgi:threonine dehydrogenase-like Zn-dependent dehydrogenase